MFEPVCLRAIKNEIREYFASWASLTRLPATSVGVTSHRRFLPRHLRSIPQSVAATFSGIDKTDRFQHLKEGDVVLDLGCGGGTDCFLASHHLRGEGRIYGVDITPELLWIASNSAIQERMDNLTFILGDVETLPILSDSVDVVITNGVICLSAQKHSIFAEAFRILRPGGRFECLDKFVNTNAPYRDTVVLSRWVGSFNGAEGMDFYQQRMVSNGFVRVEKEIIFPARKTHGPIRKTRLIDGCLTGYKPWCDS